MPARANPPQRTPQADFALGAKKRLLELGLTVKDLADEFGLNRNTVSMAIHHDVHLPTRQRIAERLSIPL